MEWLESLDQLDHRLITWVHSHLHSEFLNIIIPWLRKPLFWAPVYIYIIFILIKWYRSKSWQPILYLLLTVGLADASSTYIFKKNVQRLRPCHEEIMQKKLEVLVPCGGQYSFTSNHAANHMSMGVFLFMFWTYAKRKYRWWWIIWPILVGFAQIYVGVHYPMDVLIGFLLGGLLGFIVFKIFINNTRFNFYNNA